MGENRLLAFVDSNVLIEGFLLPLHSAAGVIALAANKQIDLIACNLVIDDTEKEILERAEQNDDCELIESWLALRKQIRLSVVPDPAIDLVKETLDKYWGIMRHKADIPILASAIEIGPNLILSDNREHFNDKVSQRCGIPILSCEEFLQNFITGNLKVTP